MFEIHAAFVHRSSCNHIEICARCAFAEHRPCKRDMRFQHDCKRFFFLSAHLARRKSASDVRRAVAILRAAVHKQQPLVFDLFIRFGSCRIVHDCAVGGISANGVEAQIEEVFALSSEHFELVRKRDFAHLLLADSLFEIAHKSDHCHAVLDVRFFHISYLDGVFDSFANGRGENVGFFCIGNTRKECVIGLFLVDEHLARNLLDNAVNVLIGHQIHAVFFKDFLAFFVEFSLVHKQRRAVL